MADIIRVSLYDLLTKIYPIFAIALLLAFLLSFSAVMIRFLGIKNALGIYWEAFKHNDECKRIIKSLYIALLLFYLFKNDSIGVSPLVTVLGVWGIHKKNGDFTSQNILNFVYFLPLIPCIWSEVRWHVQEKCIWENERRKFLSYCVKNSLIFALGVEFIQLFLQLGRFQISDIFYTSLGSVAGGVIYYIIVNRDRKE